MEVRYLNALLDALVQKEGQNRDHSGLARTAEKIKNIGEDYLYKNIHNLIKDKKPTDNLNVREAQLNSLVKHLGFPTINAFKESVDEPLDEVLLATAGTYYSFLRSNIEEGVVFRSPVCIERTDNRMMLVLKGISWDYKGEVQLSHGCLFILMRAGGKAFHHVYKIGLRKKPLVLQGVFSGVSTAFDAIGGRAVLVRTDEEFKEMTNKKLIIKDMSKSAHPLEKKLASYFKEKSGNNLTISIVNSFTMDDLV